MGKGEIKNFLLTNRKKLLILLAILMSFFLIVGIISYATTENDEYVVEVKNDGSQNVTQNGEVKVTKKIVEDTTQSLTYEVAVNNMQIKSTNPEVAIVIDTSRSMAINDIDSQVQEKANQLIQELAEQIEGVKVSISTNAGVKAGLATVNLTNYQNVINALTFEDGFDINEGINYGLSTFSTNDNNEKYLIIFSDATDSSLEILETATSSFISVYSILTDITNNEYQNNPDTTGEVTMISDIQDFSYIYNKTNYSVTNVKITDIFTDEVNEYFDFEVVSQDDGMEVLATETGYEITCDTIKSGKTKTLKFKLTLKDNVSIDSAKTYRELYTSKDMTIEFKNTTEEDRSLSMKVSPTFVICKKYSLTVEAVSEKSENLPVTDLDIKVVGTTVIGQDENGKDIVKTIFDDTLTTDSKGKIKIDNLKTLGDITFEIKPIVDQLGYTETDATQIIIHNDPTGVGTIWAESDVTTPEVDVVTRNVNVILPISVQTYSIKIETIDLNNSNVKLGDIEYRLIQPKLNSKYEMEALYGTTDENGNLTFKPAIMTKDGKYEYILSQLTSQEGYDSMGNVTLYVTFKDGNVTEFTHKYNDNVTSEYISEAEGKVTVGNTAEVDDTFKLEINVVDSEDPNIKVDGAVYDVELTRVASSGEQITTSIQGNITDLAGKIELELPGTGNVRLRITEVKPKAGYNEDSVTKEIVIVRKEGTVQYISAKNPIDINAEANSDENAVIVNLTSKLKTVQNRIQVHLIDNMERDVNIPGVALTLTKVGEETTYSGITDANGIANFIIADEVAGSYVYDIKLSSVPYGYNVSTLLLGTISVHFDENKNIDECSDIQINTPYFSPSYEFMPEEEFGYHTGKVEIGLDADDINTYNLQIKLVDTENTSKPIVGAKYDITIESGDFVRNIIGRETDESGSITTRLVGSDEITVKIKETETIKGYIINTQEQIIELTRTADVYQITNQEPYVYDPSNGSNIGAEVSGKNVIYHDTNKAKNGADTILNLYINKTDIDGNLIGGITTHFTSSTLTYEEKPLELDMVSDQNGYFEILGIKVNGAELNNGERVDYINLYEVDVNGSKKANTDITLKLTFRYNENKDIIEITNVEATWGNKLIGKREFSGYESSVAYESNVYLDIYTNYDDVGNFELDLSKVDKDDNLLSGAKYDVTVTRLDGTKLVRKDLEIDERTEFPGFLVATGTVIEITETEAPIGYALNEYTQVLIVESVDSITGEVVLRDNLNRATATKSEYLLEDGTIKTTVLLKLTDYELDTFKFGIITKDSTTLKPVSGYSFNVTSTQGADVNMPVTEEDGKTEELVGANYEIEGYTVTYTIKPLRTADYYKGLQQPIELKVVFDLNGRVDTDKTLEINENAEGYGTTWEIAATNTAGGNDIDILIKVDPQDPLIVNVQTENSITNETIADVQYQITPSINIPATGSTKVEVGYVLPNGVQTYVMKQTNGDSVTQYATMPEQQFKVQYDEEGNVVADGTVALTSAMEVVSVEGKTINVKVKLLPTLVVNIQTVDAITSSEITEIEYEITPSDKISATGNTRIEVGHVKSETTGVRYTIKQTNELINYVKIEDQSFELDYDALGKITNVNNVSNAMEVLETNDNTINVRIKAEPAVPFVITNKSYFEDTPLSNATYEISLDNASKEITTMGNGIGVNYLGKLESDTVVTYTVKQKTASVGYAKVEDFQIKVTFDEERNIKGTEIVGEVNKYVEFVEVSYKQPSTEEDEGYNGNDKGIVNITVHSYPEVQFTIENVNTNDETIKLVGTTYTVTSTIDTKAENVSTGSDGKAVAHLDKSGFNTTVTYTITELTPASRYQPLAIDAVIEVDFDDTGFIKETRIIKRDDVTEVSMPEQSSEADKLKLNIKLKSNPQLKINITKVDEEDSTIVLPNVDFEVTARIEKDNLANYTEEEIGKLTLNTTQLTEEEYLSQVLDRLKIDPEIVDEIKQNIGIEKIIQSLKDNNNLTAEEEDEINQGINNSQKINKIVELGKATKTQINQTINAVTYKEVVDSLIENGTTTQDRVNDILATIQKQVRLDAKNVTTDTEGKAIAYMDKTLANKTIEYTLKETKKAEGYDWLDEIIIIKITYDGTGKMIESNPVEVVSGNVEVTNVDIENFGLSVTIKNKPSDEVKIHLTVQDAYDSNKKLETAIFDAYLTDNGFAPDDKYRVTLASGSATANTGLATAHGEDTEVMGIYEEGAGTRVLRLVQNQTPNKYYIGNNEYSSAYQSISYALLVKVSFNAEGSVTDASLYAPDGALDDTIGIIADNRYIEVSHSRNTINVSIKYYPMLQVQLQAEDMYTGETLQGRYKISTSDSSYGQSTSSYVKSGYIGRWSNTIVHDGTTYTNYYTTSSDITEIENAQMVAIAPTEADNNSINVDNPKERIFYIFEKQEPQSPIQYQKYMPRDTRVLVTDTPLIIAKLKVYYNDLGEVENVELLQTRSNNNIQTNFVEVVVGTTNNFTIQVKVKYAPITTITATVVDEVTGKGLSGININPYVNSSSSVANTSFEYRASLTYNTDNAGKATWTYWGGSIDSGLNRYEIDTYTFGSGYNGYFDPGNIILDVTYDENGRVASVTPRSTDSYGCVNAIDITWENNDIQIKIPYSRKFNVKIDKQDYYDSNTKLNATYRVTSSEGADVELAAGVTATIGKIYPGLMVKYTLSETKAPNGYLPIENLDFYVTFNNDGSVRSTSSTSSYYEFISSAAASDDINRVNVTDMEIAIKNKPRFDIEIELSDKFYPELKLEGALFSIENSKGDAGMGGLATDENGVLELYVGPTYPSEEVTYTIRQTNTLNGYKANDYTITVTVKFNENGKIESYSLITGNETATINPTKFSGTRKIGLNVTNIPNDIKIGIEKYDKLTNEEMNDVGFNVKTEVVNEKTSNKELITNVDGTVAGIIDNFEARPDYRIVNYTISEIEIPNSYRKIQDVVIQVTYNPDGSIFLYDVLSNESNVGIYVATSGKSVGYINDIPVHIKLEIPNDNSYDLIIKNEDTYYEGLGIEGTKYDVTINGIEQEVITTNADGIATIVNQTGSGLITIKVAEREVGEGYREDPNNEATLTINKGEEIYSLALEENSNPTKATVEIDEEHGTITVTFKNETKLELNVLKENMKTGKPIEGVEFEIVEEEIDQYGNTIEDTQRTLTTEDYKLTDKQGLMYFDLGVAKQSTIMQYTITEVQELEGYIPISPIKMKVTFDMYGRISNIEDNSYYATGYLDSFTGKSHNMIFSISNELMPESEEPLPDGSIFPGYTIKVISADSQTGTRINGSIFQVEVFDENEVSYKSETGVTRDETKQIAGRTFVSEKGVMKVTGITAENNVKIAINQTETAVGYVYGSNKVVGNVRINADYEIVTGEPVRTLELSLVEDDGFDVSVDNVNREVIIKVKNDPELTFNITKIDADTEARIEGAKFSVTSVIQTSTATTATDLNEVARATDANGRTTLNGGLIYAGKTVIYTLQEEQLQDYNKLDDVIVLVRYDTKGNILYYEILSDLDDASIEDGEMNITKRIITEDQNMPGIVDVNYSTVTIPTGTGTRMLDLVIKNNKEPLDEDYQIIIEKHHELDPDYPYLIPGVKFEITVTQEYGKKVTRWTDITNEDGIIESQYFSGYGYITVEIKELEAVDGYKPDFTTKTLRFTRNKDTHKLELVGLDGERIGYDFSEDNTKVILMPVNEIESNMYNMVISKVDNNNVLIQDNPAEIEVSMIEENETLTPVEDAETGETTYTSKITEITENIMTESTDAKGRIVANMITMPREEGTYKFIIKETKAPEGYVELKEDVEMKVTFATNADNGELYIEQVSVPEDSGVKIVKTSQQLISIMIENLKAEEVVQEGEYSLNITKTDTQRNAITTDTAIFKFTDVQKDTSTYIETNEYGKLEIPKFNMPSVATTYTYILNEVKSPEGYALNREDITISLVFKQDEEGQTYLSNVTVDGENAVYESPEEGVLPSTTINIDVLNEEGQNQNVNTKPYTVILNKVDSETGENITERVEFEVSLVNGEIVYAATNEQGQIIIENIYMPAKAGEYEIIVKEITTPEGYKNDREMKILKVTFEGTGEAMIISNIEIDETYNKGIELVSNECTEDKIVFNILNEKENPELYVISRLDAEGNDIYDVLKGYDVPGKQYKIDTPFIDTKVAKRGNNMTAQEFIDNLESNGHMVILDQDGNEISPTARVKTGMTLKSTLGDQELTFTIVVKGDADGDGRVRTVDSDILCKHLTRKEVITDPIMLRALDLDGDGRVRTTDIDKLYKVLVQ